jgi:hypothetical protein
MKIDLPSGAWADLLAPDKLKSKHLRIVNRAVTKMEQRDGGWLLDMIDGAVAIMVQEWSCTDDDGNVLPVPSVNLKSLDELSIEDYETLLQHEFVQEINNRIMKVRSERISPDDVEDPDSPTVPSAESGPGLGEEPSPQKTIVVLNGTKPRSTSRSPKGGTGHRTK